jgi:hypothetical protein
MEALPPSPRLRRRARWWRKGGSWRFAVKRSSTRRFVGPVDLVSAFQAGSQDPPRRASRAVGAGESWQVQRARKRTLGLPTGVGRPVGCSCRESVAEVGETHLSGSPVTASSSRKRGSSREAVADGWPVSSSQSLTRRDGLGAGERVRGSAARVTNERNVAGLGSVIARSWAPGRTDGRRPGPFVVRRPNPAACAASLVRRGPEGSVLATLFDGSPQEVSSRGSGRGTGTEPEALGSAGRHGTSEVSLVR